MEREIVKHDPGTVKGKHGEIIEPFYKSYVVRYYPIGVIKEEGTAVYEDIEIDSLKIGEWKYYDESGKLTKTVNHEEK